MEQNEVKTDSGFDKEAWLEQKRADRKEAFDLIDVTADSLTRNAELFQPCLDVMSKFDRYSVGNILLLTAQNPNATHTNSRLKGLIENTVCYAHLHRAKARCAVSSSFRRAFVKPF